MRSRCRGASGPADLSWYGGPLDSTWKTKHSRLCATAITAAARLPPCFVVMRQNFSFRKQFLQLRDWLQPPRITHMVMASTGSYWKPVFNIFGGSPAGLFGQSATGQAAQGAQDGPTSCRHGCRRISRSLPESWLFSLPDQRADDVNRNNFFLGSTAPFMGTPRHPGQFRLRANYAPEPSTAAPPDRLPLYSLGPYSAHFHLHGRSAADQGVSFVQNDM